MASTLTLLAAVTKTFALTSLCVALLVIAGIAACARKPTGEESVTTAILDRDNPERSAYGDLTLLAGFELELDEPAFGDLSGLRCCRRRVPAGRHQRSRLVGHRGLEPRRKRQTAFGSES